MDNRDEEQRVMTVPFPTDCLYYLLSRATLGATAALRRELAAAGVEKVKPAYLGVLITLWRQDGVQATALGRKAGLEPSSMTGILDRMERDELIRRKADPSDRRAQRIHLTARGSEIRDAVMEVVDRVLAEVTDGIAEEDVARVKDTLRQVLDNTQRDRG
jgi:DNA-binding MarR family transcriptional regulator